MYIRTLLLCTILVSIYSWTTIDANRNECPCALKTSCDPIEYNGKEIFGYVLKSNFTVWSTFNFNKLTTISLVDFIDDELMCLSHELRVRVITRETFELKYISNQSYIDEWLTKRINVAQDHYLDGINLYVDDPVDSNDPRAEQLTQLVQMVTDKFHAKLPKSIVVFNVPYSPYNQKKMGVNGKNYQYEKIAQIVDRLFIMNYDQRKQAIDDDDKCMSGPNSNYYITMGSLLAYQEMNFPMNKMILGLPYYAHEYKCVTYDNIRCYIEREQYRGINCSSNVANIIPYNQMNEIDNLSGMFWDEISGTCIYHYVEKSYGYVYQIWLDRNDTLQLKFILAERNGLGGIGMWCLNYMNPGSWDNVPQYKLS
ncbi:hypothetical protein BLOT_009047 [Blomia tropicalis]|nr:hypothetical protein BLOT_009047 [Blomia tropicalis]